MTLQELTKHRDRMRAIVDRILEHHHLYDLETQYLVEVLLECRGLSNINTSRERAQADLKAILDFLECGGRISPYERRELLATGNLEEEEDE